MPRSRSLSLFFTTFLLLILLLPQLSGQYKGLRSEKIGPEILGAGNCILQDHQGFLWLGTAAGLFRFDGYGLKEYSSTGHDSLNISNTFVTVLFEDSKNRLWVGSVEGLNCFDRATETFQHYLHDPADSTSISNNYVTAILEDNSGEIWVGTNSGGLNLLEVQGGTFRRFLAADSSSHSISNNAVNSLFKDNKGNLWIGTNRGLNHFDQSTQTFTKYFAERNNPSSSQHLSYNIVYEIQSSQDNRLVIGTQLGIDIFDPADSTKPFTHHLIGTTTSFQNDRTGRYWFGTMRGLYTTKTLEENPTLVARHSPSQPSGISHSWILDTFLDREGSLWIGSLGGVDRISPEHFWIRVFERDNEDAKSISGNVISSLAEDQTGMIWVGTDQDGINLFDPQEKQFSRFPYGSPGPPSHLTSGRVLSIFQDRRMILWIGLNGTGIDRLDPTENKVGNYVFGDIRSFVTYFFEDSDSILWVGTQGGINRLSSSMNSPNLSFDFFPYSPDKPLGRSGSVSEIIEDNRGTLWVGTYLYGLRRFDREKENMRYHYSDSVDSTTLSSNLVFAIVKDDDGRIWIGTGKGLDLWEDSSESFRHIIDPKASLDNGVVDILKSKAGNLWVSTGLKLIRFDKQEQDFDYLDAVDGFPSDYLSPLLQSSKTGHIYAGTESGLVEFHPDSLQSLTEPPPVVFTSFKFYRTQGEGGTFIVQRGMEEKDQIDLTYRDDILQFEVSALSYRKTARNQYAYRLFGLHENWIPLGTKREITFTELVPGNYVLQVKASNGDGIWNEEGRSLKIRIAPPWYWNAWTKSLYLLLGLLGIFSLYRFLLTRQLEKAENRRLKEIDLVRTRLYTNITHEFRTPLTVILGMADQIAKSPTEWVKEGTKLIKRNGQQLLGLINQVLDLRKLETGNMPLNMIPGDIVPYLKYVSESFHSLAESKDIQLEFVSEIAELEMDYDPERILQILSNLLSNAIKFTPAGGKVTVTLARDQGTFKDQVKDKASQPAAPLIRVKDDGIGIPAEKLPHIFDRFYQVNDASTRKAEGTGVGLALTRELVSLLNGDINVKSTEGIGTEFTLRLPTTNTASISSEKPPLAGIPLGPPLRAEQLYDGRELMMVDTSGQPLVLIVEDNRDVAQFIGLCLDQDYRIAFATDGKQGLEHALSLLPDIIISDVMMPELDGFELCQRLKTEARTSHIPIVLLTAKADIESKITGLGHGADAYLAKPFHQEELLIRLRKLLELRIMLQQRFLTAAGLSDLEITQFKSYSDLDQQFLRNVRTTIEQHMDDANFSIPDLRRKLGISNSHLHRKLTALTGMSATRYLRALRLAKAKALLSDTGLTIAEIAYETGFNDPDYFARSFKKAFELTPSDFRKQA